MTIHITSDLHFGHTNIIKYCPASRGGFAGVDEMDSAIIHEWRSKVQQHDTVYHLGDFTFHRDLTLILDILNMLPGKKIFINGNHDKMTHKAVAMYNQTAAVPIEEHDYKEIYHKGSPIVLFHFPIESWHKQHYGSIHFHGHCHGSLPSKGRRMDVGWDVEARMFTLDEVVKRMQDVEQLSPNDHHKAV